MQSLPPEIREVQPLEAEKLRRPPMIAFKVREHGDVREVRIARHSGIKELDEQLLVAASHWKYAPRPGCGVAKVPLAAGPIPNESTAINAVLPELIHIYGASQIAREEPFSAELSGETWTVGGTLHCGDGKGGTTTLCVGGVAYAYLSKSDGRVIGISHGK
jgi:TonB family protein